MASTDVMLASLQYTLYKLFSGVFLGLLERLEMPFVEQLVEGRVFSDRSVYI